jgi:hypothetical protein
MARTHTSGGNQPQTCQKKFDHGGTETQPSTAIPRCTEHDLESVTSRTRTGTWGDECTFKVPKRGNRVTEGGNF